MTNIHLKRELEKGSGFSIQDFLDGILHSTPDRPVFVQRNWIQKVFGQQLNGQG